MPLVGLGLKAFQLLELKFFTSEGHLQQIGSNKLYLLYVPETGCGGAALSDLGTPDGNSNTQKHQRAVDAGAVPVRRKGRACCRYHTFLGPPTRISADSQGGTTLPLPKPMFPVPTLDQEILKTRYFMNIWCAWIVWPFWDDSPY